MGQPTAVLNRRPTLEMIEQEFIELVDQIESAHDAGVDVPTEVVEAFWHYFGQRGAKIDRTAAMLARLDSERALARSEAALYAKMAQRKEHAIERIKAMVLDVMRMSGTDEMKGELRRFKRVAGQPKVRVTDADFIPEEYLNPPAAPTPNLAAILRELKDGAVIPGAELEQGADFVRIYTT